MLERKAIGPLEIKNEEKGEVQAVLATLGVVDRDRDVILPDVAVDGAKAKLSGYAHDIVLGGQAPVGKGSAAVKGDELVFSGRYFLSTDRGRESFRTMKELGPDSEWSFGYEVTKTSPLTEEWKEKGAQRLITGLRVLEASPVFQGAGIGTGIMSIKADGSLSERVRHVVDAVWQQLIDTAGPEGWMVEAVFEDAVIVRAGMRHLRVPYVIEDAQVVLGEPEEVRIEYVAVEDSGEDTGKDDAPGTKAEHEGDEGDDGQEAEDKGEKMAEEGGEDEAVEEVDVKGEDVQEEMDTEGETEDAEEEAERKARAEAASMEFLRFQRTRRRLRAG